MEIRNSKDFWAGLMFVVVGLFFMLWAVGQYQMGTAVRMGPAYFPAVLGGLLATLGAVIFLRAFFSRLTDSAAGRIPFSAKDLAIGVASVALAAWLSRWFSGSAEYGILAAAFILSVLANRYRLKGASASLRLPFNVADFVIGVVVFYVAAQLSFRYAKNSDYGMLAAAALLSVLAVLFRPGAKPLMLVVAAGIAYGYLMKPLGLVLATAVLVFVSALGGHEFKWKEVVTLYVVLIVFSLLVFFKALSLPFPICPEFIDSCPIR